MKANDRTYQTLRNRVCVQHDQVSNEGPAQQNYRTMVDGSRTAAKGDMIEHCKLQIANRKWLLAKALRRPMAT